MKKKQDKYGRKFTRCLFGVTATLLGLATGCESGDFAKADPDQAVVEAFLHAGRAALVSINQQCVYEREDTTFVQPVGGLDVILSDLTDGSHELLREDSVGYYGSDRIIAEGHSYRIDFEYAGKSVWATTTVPERPVNFRANAESLLHTERFSDDTIRYVTYTWDNPAETFHLQHIRHMESWTTPIYNYYGPRTKTYTPSVDTTFQVNSREFDYYGRHYVVLFRVNQEYVDLYYSNSSNSQNMTNPPTNVNNGYGIFTGINSDTLILKLY